MSERYDVIVVGASVDTAPSRSHDFASRSRLSPPAGMTAHSQRLICGKQAHRPDYETCVVGHGTAAHPHFK